MNHLKFKKNDSICVSILRHLRNSFAHGNLNKDENNGIYILEDYNTNKKLTAYAIINKDILFEFIQLLEDSKENFKQQIENKKRKIKGKGKNK